MNPIGWELLNMGKVESDRSRPSVQDLRREAHDEKSPAWTAYINTQYSRLFRLAVGFCHGNKEDARDLLQDSTLRLLNRVRNPQPLIGRTGEEMTRREFDSYFTTIIRNLAVNNARRRTRKPFLEELASQLSDGRDFTDDSDAKLVATEMVVQLRQSGMNPKFLEVLCLDAAGFSGDDISQITGRKEETVRTRLFRGRLIARDQLEGLIDPRQLEGRNLKGSKKPAV